MQEILQCLFHHCFICEFQECLLVVKQQIRMEHVLIGQDSQSFSLLKYQTSLGQVDELFNQKVVLEEERPVVPEFKQERGVQTQLLDLRLLRVPQIKLGEELPVEVVDIVSFENLKASLNEKFIIKKEIE